MSFRDFIQMDEVGTSTSCIAGFKRIAIPNVRRIFPPELGWVDPEDEKKKKNPYRVPQLKENFGALMQGMGQGFGMTGPAMAGPMAGNQQNAPMAMKQAAQTAKNSAQQAKQLSATYSARPEAKQLQTLLTSISSSYNRISDQWTQASNLAATTQNQQQTATQTRQYGANPVTNAINSIGNAVQGVIGRGGALSQGQAVR